MKTMRCYVDGSYSPKSVDETLAGWGVVFEHGDSYSGSVEHKGTRQIAGECMATLEAVRTILEERDGEKLIIFYDYQGLPEWANGTWKAKNEITKQYQEEIQEAMKHIDIKFVKVDPAVNKADALATEAIGIQSVH
jgi:ribonuclease HI